MQRSYYRQLALHPLGPEAVDELLGELLGTGVSLAELRELIRARTGGNPFYVEEVVQALLDQRILVRDGGGPPQLVRPLAEIEIPTTVHDLLAARIDRLGEREKSVLQTAAVVGKEFSLSVLERVVAGEPVAAALPELLRALTAGEFLYETALYPQAEYAFKHPLTQEVAYDSQLRARRAQVHAAVARTLATSEAERLDERAALVAHHFEAAGETLDAARWYARAAEWAGLNSPAEAGRHWERVRGLVCADATDPEAVQLAFLARARLLSSAYRVGGLSEEAAGQLFDEARAIADRIGTARARFIVIGSHQVTLWMQGRFRSAHDLGEELLGVAEASGADDLRCWARWTTSLTDWSLGEIAVALARTDEAIELLSAGLDEGIFVLRTVPLAGVHHHRGLYLAEVGRLDDARASLAHGLEVMRRLGGTELVAWCEAALARVTGLAGDVETALGHAGRALDGVEKVGSSFGRVYVYWILGQVLVLRGRAAEAIEHLTAAIDLARASRVGVFVEPFAFAELADARLGLGDLPGARSAVEQGIAALGEGEGAWVRLDLALARVLRADGDTAGAAAALERVRASAELKGARIHVPFVHLERAELARLRGDESSCRRERREAQRLFTEMGASARAAMVSRDL